jgi:hypothetical protein
MIEIALCLAIVGFALVAIIGVLPAGLNVQKENREDTLLNQDASIWLDAIRAGGVGPYSGGSFDDLTNYVDRVVVLSTLYTFTATATNPAAPTSVLVGQTSLGGNILITNGAQIVGLLTTPEILTLSTNSFSSNYVYAYVRAINGSAAEKAPQSNKDVRDLAFNYKLIVEVAPLGVFDPAGIRTNRADRIMRANISDIRLLFRWPLGRPVDPNQPLVDPPVGIGRMSFRTQLGGAIGQARDTSGVLLPYYYLQPHQFIP